MLRKIKRTNEQKFKKKEAQHSNSMELKFSIDKRYVQEIIEKSKIILIEMMSNDINARDCVNKIM